MALRGTPGPAQPLLSFLKIIIFWCILERNCCIWGVKRNIILISYILTTKVLMALDGPLGRNWNFIKAPRTYPDWTYFIVREKLFVIILPFRAQSGESYITSESGLDIALEFMMTSKSLQFATILINSKKSQRFNISYHPLNPSLDPCLMSMQHDWRTI